MKISVIIPTYNRAADLKETIASMARLSTDSQWELVIVDNNSTDQTAGVTRAAQDGFPAPLRYLFEPEQGRCAALNTGILASTGEIVVTTDDDVRVEADWLDRATQGLNSCACDYIGGRVLPIWSVPRPRWLPNRGGRHWAVVALLDYGPAPLEFGKLMPLGVNMAFRREAFSRAGLWDNRLGRKAGTLLGQEVREWGLRARDAGLKGFYVPEFVIHHVIPPDRLNKRYFRRWFYWHGISRAMLYRDSRINMEAPEETHLDYSIVPHIAGVPRYMYRSCLRAVADMLGAHARRNTVAAFEHELWVWFFAGIVSQRLKDRGHGQPKGKLNDDTGMHVPLGESDSLIDSEAAQNTFSRPDLIEGERLPQRLGAK